MSRPRMSLSLSDMENVVRIVEYNVNSVAAAAEILGTDRAYVYRLIQRINAMIGKHAPSWREGNRLVIPTEIQRLAARMRSLAVAFDEATRFPRIAVGNTVAILVDEVLHEIKWKQTSYEILRSSGAMEAVSKGEVDLALFHEESLEDDEGGVQDGEDLPGDLEWVKLLEWQGVIVEPPRKPVQKVEEEPRWLLAWPPDTHAARLNARVWGESWDAYRGRLGPCLGSYVAALEAIRIGLPYMTIIPDIYLMPADWQSLTITYPSPVPGGWLIGLCRRSDRHRLQSILRRDVWERVRAKRQDREKGASVPR